jgi:ribosomal protein S18 acetylase RimI-like enzyme
MRNIFYKKMAEKREMVCYLLNSPESEPIGFGVVRLIDGKYWLTGGLLEKERAKGYGQILFQKLVEVTPSNEVWLDVLTTNKVGQHVYQKLGFREVERSKKDKGKKLIIMKLLKK